MKLRIDDLCAQLLQGKNKVADRPLPHARISIQDIVAVSQRQESRQEARCRSSISDKELCFLSRYNPALPNYSHLSMGRIKGDIKPQLLQCP